MLAELRGFGITNLATEPSAVVNPNHSGSMAYGAVTTYGGKFEEAEMPSDEAIAPSPEDGLYHCQYEGCQRLDGYTLKSQLRYASHPI